MIGRGGAIGLGLAGLAAAAVFFATAAAQEATAPDVPLAGDALVAVSLPATFTDQEQRGEAAFVAVCADCHGVNGRGRDGKAPPLIHKIYEPSHHGDMAFVMAAQQGVRQHHWAFGNMPAVAGITEAEVRDIVAYVRAVQRANGIN